jgi:hypothetical protein
MSEITIPDFLAIRRRPAAELSDAPNDAPAAYSSDAPAAPPAASPSMSPAAHVAVPRIFVKRQVSPVFGWRDGGQDFEFKDFDPLDGPEIAKHVGVTLVSDEYRAISNFLKADHEEEDKSGVIGDKLRNFRRFELLWRTL